MLPLASHRKPQVTQKYTHCAIAGFKPETCGLCPVVPLAALPQSNLCLKGISIFLVFIFLYFEMNIWDPK